MAAVIQRMTAQPHCWSRCILYMQSTIWTIIS